MGLETLFELKNIISQFATSSVASGVMFSGSINDSTSSRVKIRSGSWRDSDIRSEDISIPIQRLILLKSE